MSAAETLREIAAECGYSEDEECGVDALIDYKNALEDRLGAAMQHRAALLEIHRGLFPERYGLHDEYGIEEGDVLQWDAGTIEWVADAIDRALAGDPDWRAMA